MVLTLLSKKLKNDEVKDFFEKFGFKVIDYFNNSDETFYVSVIATGSVIFKLANGLEFKSIKEPTVEFGNKAYDLNSKIFSLNDFSCVSIMDLDVEDNVDLSLMWKEFMNEKFHDLYLARYNEYIKLEDNNSPSI